MHRRQAQARHRQRSDHEAAGKRDRAACGRPGAHPLQGDDVCLLPGSGWQAGGGRIRSATRQSGDGRWGKRKDTHPQVSAGKHGDEQGNGPTRIDVTQPAVTWHPAMTRRSRNNPNTRCYCPRTFSGILMAASVIQREGAC